jgi:predicted CXXCH cytochrome family protein
MSASSISHAHDEHAIKPDIPKGKGEQCVAETDFMRRNHMELLKHDRDLTMYHGLREIDFSLKGCIDCHAVKDAKGQAITVKDERHFCRTCHDFAAVTVDCFQCHASRPGMDNTASLDNNKMPRDKVHKEAFNKTSKANKASQEEVKP